MNQTAATQDNRVISGMDIDAYHAHHAVSRSGLMEVDQCPQKYWWQYLSGLAEKIDTLPLRIGGAFHTLILEPQTFDARAVILPDGAPSKPTKAQLNAAKPAPATIEAIQWWHQFEMYRAGRTLLKQDDFNDLKDMAEALRNHPASSKVIGVGGEIEESYFWYEPEYGVHVKARPDFRTKDCKIVVDVKSTADASRDAFQRSVIEYGYDIQAYMQLRGITICQNIVPEAFVFACVEKKKPNCVAYWMADDDILASGKWRYEKLLRKFSDCKKSGVWPGYGNMVMPLGVPDWHMKKLEKENG